MLFRIKYIIIQEHRLRMLKLLRSRSRWNMYF